MEPSQRAIIERSRDLHRLHSSAVDGAYRTPPSSVAGSLSSHGSSRQQLGRREDKRQKRSHRPISESLADPGRGSVGQRFTFEGHNYNGDVSRQNSRQMPGYPDGHWQKLQEDQGYQAISKITEHASLRHLTPPPYPHTDIPPGLAAYHPGGPAVELENPGKRLLSSPRTGDILLYYSHSLSRSASDRVPRSSGDSSGLVIYGQRPDGGEKLPYPLDIEHLHRDRTFGLPITKAQLISGSSPQSYGNGRTLDDRWSAYNHLRQPVRSPRKVTASTLPPSTASTNSTMTQTRDALPTTPPLPRWSTGPSQDKPGESSTVPRLAPGYGEPMQGIEMVSQPSGESIQSGYSDQYPPVELSPSSLQPTLHPRSHSDPSKRSRHDEEERTMSSRSPQEGAGSSNDEKRRKRTRVLMTHSQQATLGKLWKTTKFPGTGERSGVARAVGLSSRQVQVWFQNRRQTFRKQIATNTIPEGADPADYADLQASPRSRRLVLEASKAADKDRVTAWASSAVATSTGGSLGLAFDNVEGDPGRAMDEHDEGNEPRSAGLSSSVSFDREPRRGASLWEMDEDERLPARSEHDDRRSSKVSPRATTSSRKLQPSSNIRESTSDPLQAREPGPSSSSLSSSFSQSSRAAHPSYPAPEHSHSPIPQPPRRSDATESVGGESQLPPSLRALTLAGPTASYKDRKRSSFGSLEAHHYDTRPSARSSPLIPQDDRGAPSLSARDNPPGKGPRDWFPSSMVDRKWLGLDNATVASPTVQESSHETPRDLHSRFSLQVDAQHRQSEPSHSTSHNLPEVDHRSAKYTRSHSESQPSDRAQERDRRMSFERGDPGKPGIDDLLAQRVGIRELPRFRDIFK